MIKRVMSIKCLMFLAFILVLAACAPDNDNEEAAANNNGSGNNNTEEDGDNNDGEENDVDGAAGSDEEAELRVWIMETGSPEEAEDYFDRVTESFNEDYPNVSVDVQFIPWLSAHQNLITAIAGGSAPDISELGTTWNPEFAAMGALADMDGVVQEWEMEDGWVEALEEVATYDDTLYGIPWYAGVRQLIYNTELFEEAGVDAPETMDELWEVSEAIVENTDAYAYPAVGISQHFVLPKIWHFGGELAIQEEDDEGELRWVSQVDQPEAVEAVEFYTDMYKEGFVPDGALNWSVLESRQAFAQEDIAMTIDLPPGINAMISENPEIEDKIAVAPLPGNESNASFVGGSNLAVFEQSQNKELANEYLRVMVSDEFITEWADFTGFFPGTIDGLENPIFTEDETLTVFSEAMVEGRSYPASPSWGRFEGENLFVAPIQEIMSGDRTAQEAMEDMAESMNNAFQSE